MTREQLDELRTSLESLHSSQSSLQSEMGTAFQQVENDSASGIGLWTTCRVIRALIENKGIEEELPYHPNGEMESLLLRKAWNDVFHQHVGNSPKQDRDNSLFDVFSTCARQLPKEGHVFSSFVGERKAVVHLVLLPKEEVVVVAQVATLDVELWHSHKSKFSITKKDWDRWISLDQGPGLDPISIPIKGKDRTGTADCLRRLLE